MTPPREFPRGASRHESQLRPEEAFDYDDRRLSWRLDRFQWVRIILAIMAAALAFRIMYLQLSKQDFLQNEGDKRSVRHESIPAHRGIIFDRNGEPLAVSTPVVAIGANPQELLKDRTKWAELAKLLGMTHAELITAVAGAKNKDFIYLKRQQMPEVGEAIAALKIQGIDIIEEHRRFYPAAEVTAHVIGFTDIDENGQEGLELAYNKWLTGEEGERRVLKDRKGQLAREAELVSSASPGKELMLSIDLRLQYMAYRELSKAVQQYRAKAGSLVMLDVKTGEVLAMVNQPAYNPNNRGDMQAYKMRNRVLTDMFEPGSTIKPFVVAAALESGKFTKDTLINTSPGVLKVGKDTVRDEVNMGILDVTSVLRRSSNVGMTKMILATGHVEVIQLLHRFGMGSESGTGFPGESSGELPFRDRWSDIEKATLSYGYGLTVTPLQLAQAYAVIGAGGVLRPVTLLKRDVVPEGYQALEQGLANDVRKMLKDAVATGTGRKAQVKSFAVGGKTGTARKVINGVYSKERYVAMFGGLAPIDDPRLAIAIVIDDPSSGSYYGGQTAAPVFAEVAAGALHLLGVMPVDNEE